MKTSEHNKALIVEASRVMNAVLMGKRIAIVGGFPRDVLRRADAKDIDIMVLGQTADDAYDDATALMKEFPEQDVQLQNSEDYVGETAADSTLVAVVQMGDVDVLYHSTDDAREVLRQFDCNINQFIFHNNGAIVFGGDAAPDQHGLIFNDTFLAKCHSSGFGAAVKRRQRLQDIYEEMVEYL